MAKKKKTWNQIYINKGGLFRGTKIKPLYKVTYFSNPEAPLSQLVDYKSSKPLPKWEKEKNLNKIYTHKGAV